MSPESFHRRVPIAFAWIVFLGCCTTPGHCAEGRDAGSWPTRLRLKHAFSKALRSPATWAPAAGAAVMASTDWDGKVSRWAVERTPVFGSARSAREWSDNLRTATHVGMIGTALAVPGTKPSWKPKLQRLLVEQAGSLLAINTTNVLKEVTQRERPDASDQASFPSGHSTKAFSYAAFGCRNLEATELPEPVRRGLGIGFYTVAAGTAWARIEGGVHYPSDVLGGAALGNFLALFIHDAFLGASDRVTVDVEVSPRNASFTARLRF